MDLSDSTMLSNYVLGAAGFAMGLLIVGSVLYGIYFLITLPMRRTERARLFLDLLERGLKEGKSPEAVVVAASASCDRVLGVRFHLLAAYLERGMRLGQGLDRTPGFLPPRVTAVLKAGERIGEISRVLPGCFVLIKDGVSHVRAALNYLILFIFVTTPFAVFVPIVIRVKVIPSYQQVFQSMTDGGSLPWFTTAVFDQTSFITAIQVLIVASLWLLALAYFLGPRNLFHDSALAHRLEWLLPWRRKRLYRDFSALLAISLDGGLPEPDALRLAAECTRNNIMIQRAAAAERLLREGAVLPLAIRDLDDRGEFRWRLANAMRRGHGFLPALQGWHQSLEARAFKDEQAAAQITSAALVVLNGLLVGCLFIGIFLALIQLLNTAVLW